MQGVQLGQAQIAPGSRRIGALLALLEAGLEGGRCLFVIAALRQQAGAEQLGTPTDRVGLRAPGGGQFRAQAGEQGFRAQQFAADFQQLHVLEGQQAFDGQAAMFARLLDGLAVEFLGLVEFTFDQCLLDLQHATQQALAPGPLRQLIDGLGHQRLRLLGIATVESQLARQGLPLGDQLELPACIGLGQETAERIDEMLCLFEPAAEQQDPGIDQGQTWRGDLYRQGQRAPRLQQQGDPTALQQTILGVAFHEAGGHFRLLRLERVLQRRAYLFLAHAPLAGLAEQGLGHAVRQLSGQQRGERPPHPQELPLLVDRLDEQTTGAQLIEQLTALAHPQQLLAQVAIELRELGEGIQRQPPLLGQLVEHLALQVLQHQCIATFGRERLARLDPEQPQAKPRAPALRLLQQGQGRWPRPVQLRPLQ
ncbi:hypothetical protein D3C84_483930 [compost metagenome]